MVKKFVSIVFCVLIASSALGVEADSGTSALLCKWGKDANVAINMLNLDLLSNEATISTATDGSNAIEFNGFTASGATVFRLMNGWRACALITQK